MTKVKCSSIGGVSVAALAMMMLVPPMRGEDATKLAERLRTADMGSALDALDVKPWHLKMTVELFDEKTNSIDQGTIEEWWSSPETNRREYSINAYTATEIRSGGKLYRTKGVGSPPYYLELLRQQAVHAMPKSSEIDESAPELRKNFAGKVALDCIMLSQPMKQFGFLPLGLFPTYCFDPGKDVLRASFEFGQQTVLRNALGTFQGRTLARDVTVMSKNAKAASSHMVKLEGILPDSEFALSDDVIEQSLSAVQIISATAAGYLLTRPDPIYPESAKQKHISGTVVMRAVIGTDGHIHSLKLESGPDPDLAISAIAAVRKSTYKPFLLNGAPSDVITTIAVNYAVRPE